MLKLLTVLESEEGWCRISWRQCWTGASL